MKDTNPKINEKFINLIMEKTPAERLIMGCSMFDAAKQIVISAIKEAHPGISDLRMKEEIFMRFYGTDFSALSVKKILKSFK
ncbi:MAG: hypothetical protein ABIH00_11200 [Armatimonadota bacterium]